MKEKPGDLVQRFKEVELFVTTMTKLVEQNRIS